MREDIAKQIHEKAAPFVTWLRTAEEESSEDEEEDEVEVVYSEKATGGITTETPVKAEEQVCMCGQVVACLKLLCYPVRVLHFCVSMCVCV